MLFITMGLHVLVQLMGKNKVLVKVNPEGKYVVDLDKEIDINKVGQYPGEI